MKRKQTIMAKVYHLFLPPSLSIPLKSYSFMACSRRKGLLKFNKLLNYSLKHILGELVNEFSWKYRTKVILTSGPLYDFYALCLSNY